MDTSFFRKLKLYFTNIWFLWGICLILNIITFLFIYFKIHPGSKTLALHYNVLVGVEWYGAGKNLYFIPVAGLAILLVNFILFKALKGTKNFWDVLCVLVSLGVELVLFASAIFLVKVN